MSTSPLSRKRLRRHTKGQGDHVDAWLISYADLITLLFMYFVVLVSVTYVQQKPTAITEGQSEEPWAIKHSGFLKFGTPYDELYPVLVGIVVANNADRAIAVEKRPHGLSVDISSVHFFKDGTADIPAEELSLLKDVIRKIQMTVTPDDRIEVEGYTDDAPLENSKFTNNWELAAMQATRIVMLLIEAGVDPAQLHASSYAGNEPVVPNADVAGKPIDENRRRNQRVIIRMEKTPAQTTSY